MSGLTVRVIVKINEFDTNNLGMHWFLKQILEQDVMYCAVGLQDFDGY